MPQHPGSRRRSQKRPRISIVLTDEEYAQLGRVGRQVDRSLSWLGRLAVRQLLQAHASGQLELPLELPQAATPRP